MQRNDICNCIPSCAGALLVQRLGEVAEEKRRLAAAKAKALEGQDLPAARAALLQARMKTPVRIS